MMCQPGAPQGWLDADAFDLDHYEFCKERASSEQERRSIDSLVRANQLCCDAAECAHLQTRMKKVREAQSMCPTHCPLAHIMLFEMEASKLVEGADIGHGSAVERALRSAVSAGRELVTLLKANEFSKGALYCFEPTRNYIRGIYMLGSLFLYRGQLKEAFDCFQECLANDLPDCLGARHKQLFTVL
jgi:hypothetical protein